TRTAAPGRREPPSPPRRLPPGCRAPPVWRTRAGRLTLSRWPWTRWTRTRWTWNRLPGWSLVLPLLLRRRARGPRPRPLLAPPGRPGGRGRLGGLILRRRLLGRRRGRRRGRPGRRGQRDRRALLRVRAERHEPRRPELDHVVVGRRAERR